jgi:hypothetical protein
VISGRGVHRRWYVDVHGPRSVYRIHLGADRRGEPEARRRTEQRRRDQ